MDKEYQLERRRYYEKSRQAVGSVERELLLR